MSHPRITVLGSLNVDLVSYVDKHPQPGETMTAKSFSTSFGGKGANQAVACGKLSRSSSLKDSVADVYMIGAVGSDGYGQDMKKALAANGVDVENVRSIESGKTGIAMIVVEEATGQNRIILSPEANHELTPNEFRAWPYERPDLLILQLEIPLETVLTIMTVAQRASIPILLNPAPAQTLPVEAYANITHLVLNETEALLLSGLEESSLADETSLQGLAESFIAKGVQYVVITLGERGVYFATQNKQRGLVPAVQVKVVDTTAAGDTFIGSYSLSVVQAGPAGFDVARAVEQANRAASITVTRKGAQASIPWREEVV